VPAAADFHSGRSQACATLAEVSGISIAARSRLLAGRVPTHRAVRDFTGHELTVPPMDNRDLHSNPKISRNDSFLRNNMFIYTK
jgi:hypothetical protein